MVRGGDPQIVDAASVVPGDLLLLEAGDAVAADARVVHGASLQLAEAALTGESMPLGKDAARVAEDTPLAERTDMVYAGTHVTAGRGRVVVVATGGAMGITGTDVAKEAAKIVIGDDHFATIVAAVEEGRIVYRNIHKAVLLLVSTSVAEAAVLLLAILLGYPPPFAAVQVLWNNLVTEGLITVNLVMEPAEGDEMKKRPIAPDEPLLNRALVTRLAWIVPVIVILTLGWFIVRLAMGVPEAQVRTETFTLLVILRVVQRAQLSIRDSIGAQLATDREPVARRWVDLGQSAADCGRLLSPAR